MPSKEDFAYMDKQRVEDERREDDLRERDIWTNTMLAILEDDTIQKAIEGADKVLAAYRERFQ